MIPYRSFCAALVCAAALAVSPPAFAQKDEAARVESFTLANGLEVIVIPNHRIPAVSHMVWYRIGAADDPPGKSGLAHYHEHMMYQGTEKFKPGQYADIIAHEGGEQNAFTGYDATSYYIDIAKDKLPLAMQMEAERMKGLKPDDAGAAREKQVIIEERRMRIENNPRALLNEQVNAMLFRNHPYHWPVIGWLHEMEGLSKDDVLQFHRTWYHPNNAILIVSGDVTAAEVRALAQTYYGPLPKVAVPPRVWRKEPPQNAARRITMHHVNVKQPEWSRSYSADSLGNGDTRQALPLMVLSQLLGGGKTSRLYQSLVVDQKIATGVDAGYNGFSLGPAEFELTVVPEAGVGLDRIEDAVDKEIARLLAEGPDGEEMRRAKTQLKAESVYARDGLSSMARIMGWLRIDGLDKDYFTRWPELIEAVTPEQVAQAAKATLVIDHSVTAQLLPGQGAKP